MLNIAAMGTGGNNDELWRRFWGLFGMQQHHYHCGYVVQIQPFSHNLTSPAGSFDCPKNVMC